MTQTLAAKIVPPPSAGAMVRRLSGKAETGAGFDAGLYAIPAGLVEVSASLDHVLALHVGAPVREACRVDGRIHRRLQTHGDIDILPAGLSGVWEDETAGTALLMRLTPAFLRMAAEGMGLDGTRVALEPRFQLQDPRIQHIGWALKAELDAGDPGGRLYAESLGTALAAHLLRRYVPIASATRRQGLTQRQERRVLEYIETHLDESLSLQALAGIAGISLSHFKALFRQSLGFPVHQYVIRRRVERARALLLTGRVPMSQVALDAGFAHQSHMARAMRRVLGVTPSIVARSRS